MANYKVQPLDLMQLINSKYHDPFIHERLEFDSCLDKERFIIAITVLADVFPIIKCHYDKGNNLFVENENFSASSLVKTVKTANKEDILTESLDQAEKLIQFTLSDSSLYITVSHMVCDGSGFKQLIYALCDIYNGADSSDYEYLMNRDFALLTKDLSGKALDTAKMLVSMVGNYKNKPIYEKSDRNQEFVIEKTIAAEVMKRIHSLAKKQGSTLNDVFLTAFARALHRQLSLDKINIPCTVDLRKYASEKMGAANMTGTYNLNIKPNGDVAFSDTLSAVTDKMKKQKKTRNDISGPMLLVSKYEKSSLDSFMKLYGGMETSAFTDYTNLGIIDNKRLVFDGVKVMNAVGYSEVSNAPNFQIAVSSFMGATTISALFRCSESERKKAEILMESLISELINFADMSV